MALQGGWVSSSLGLPFVNLTQGARQLWSIVLMKMCSKGEKICACVCGPVGGCLAEWSGVWVNTDNCRVLTMCA
jgi:hypothetical protein